MKIKSLKQSFLKKAITVILLAFALNSLALLLINFEEVWTLLSSTVSFNVTILPQQGQQPLPVPSNESPQPGTRLLPPFVLNAKDFNNEQTERLEWIFRMENTTYAPPFFEGYTFGNYKNSFNAPDDIFLSGEKYFWRVRYKTNDNRWSDYSVETDFTIYVPPVAPSGYRDLNPASIPTGLKGEFKDGNIVLTWTDPTDSDLRYIEILKGYPTRGIFISPIAYSAVSGGVGTFVDTKSTLPGEKVEYALRSIDISNNYSEMSAVVAVTVPQISLVPPATPKSGTPTLKPVPVKPVPVKPVPVKPVPLKPVPVKQAPKPSTPTKKITPPKQVAPQTKEPAINIKLEKNTIKKGTPVKIKIEQTKTKPKTKIKEVDTQIRKKTGEPVLKEKDSMIPNLKKKTIKDAQRLSPGTYVATFSYEQDGIVYAFSEGFEIVPRPPFEQLVSTILLWNEGLLPILLLVTVTVMYLRRKHKTLKRRIFKL